MTAITFSYTTQSLLTCRCSGEIIICVPPELTANGAPFIYGSIVSYSQIEGACEEDLYTYLLSYDATQLLVPATPLLGCQVTGIVCEGCFSSFVEWKAPFEQQLCENGEETPMFVLPCGTPNADCVLAVDSIGADGRVYLKWSCLK